MFGSTCLAIIQVFHITAGCPTMRDLVLESSGDRTSCPTTRRPCHGRDYTLAWALLWIPLGNLLRKDAPPDLLHASNSGFRGSETSLCTNAVFSGWKQEKVQTWHKTDVCPPDNQARAYNNTVNTHNLSQVCYCCCFVFGDWLKGRK